MFFNKIHLVDWAEFTNFASVNKTETVIGLSPHLNHIKLHVMDKENKKPIVYDGKPLNVKECKTL